MCSEEYQEAVASFMQSSLSNEQALSNWALGLAGESGEVIELVKKHLYHGKPLDEARVKEEVGGVLWYVAALLNQLGLSLGEVMGYNIAQLEARHGGRVFDKSRVDFGKEK